MCVCVRARMCVCVCACVPSLNQYIFTLFPLAIHTASRCYLATTDIAWVVFVVPHASPRQFSVEATRTASVDLAIAVNPFSFPNAVNGVSVTTSLIATVLVTYNDGSLRRGTSRATGAGDAPGVAASAQVEVSGGGRPVSRDVSGDGSAAGDATGLDGANSEADAEAGFGVTQVAIIGGGVVIVALILVILFYWTRVRRRKRRSRSRNRASSKSRGKSRRGKSSRDKQRSSRSGAGDDDEDGGGGCCGKGKAGGRRRGSKGKRKSKKGKGTKAKKAKKKKKSTKKAKGKTSKGRKGRKGRGRMTAEEFVLSASNETSSLASPPHTSSEAGGGGKGRRRRRRSASPTESCSRSSRTSGSGLISGSGSGSRSGASLCSASDHSRSDRPRRRKRRIQGGHTAESSDGMFSTSGASSSAPCSTITSATGSGSAVTWAGTTSSSRGSRSQRTSELSTASHGFVSGSVSGLTASNASSAVELASPYVLPSSAPPAPASSHRRSKPGRRPAARSLPPDAAARASGVGGPGTWVTADDGGESSDYGPVMAGHVVEGGHVPYEDWTSVYSNN